MEKFETVIILVNYNGFEDTQNCIQSIEKISGEKPFIILVDNDSKSREKLNTLKTLYSPLHIIFNEFNVGFGRANNVGIQWALKNVDFQYLLLLNNDTLIEPDTVEYLIQPFSQGPKIGITTGKILYETNRDIVWYGGGKINYKRGWPRIDDYNKKASSEGANKSKFVDFISGCTMMFSKESIKEIKGFDEDFFMYCEDLELCIRAKKLGFKLYYESRSLIYHKVQGSTKRESSTYTDDHPKNPNLSFLLLNMKINQYRTFKKHLSGFQYLLFLMVYWIELFFKLSKYLFYGRFDLLNTYKRIIVQNLNYRYLKN